MSDYVKSKLTDNPNIKIKKNDLDKIIFIPYHNTHLNIKLNGKDGAKFTEILHKLIHMSTLSNDYLEIINRVCGDIASKPIAFLLTPTGNKSANVISLNLNDIIKLI